MEASGVIKSLESLWFYGNSLSGAQRILLGLAADHEKPTEMEPTFTGEAELQNSEQGHCPEHSGGEELAEKMAEEERSSSGGGRARMRRKKTGAKGGTFNQKGRKVLGELDVGFNSGRRDHLLWLVVDGMPPLSDRNAMKEHLKCWAHAVACTVK